MALPDPSKPQDDEVRFQSFCGMQKAPITHSCDPDESIVRQNEDSEHLIGPSPQQPSSSTQNPDQKRGWLPLVSPDLVTAPGGVPVPGGATDIAQHLLSHGFSTVFPRLGDRNKKTWGKHTHTGFCCRKSDPSDYCWLLSTFR